MAFPLVPLLTAGAGIFSAMSARRGQQEANAREMDFNRDEAYKDREWQESMSNTAYQRARKDLEDANFNPIMALGHPASTPAGAVASAHPKSERSEEAAITSMVAKNAADVRLTDALFSKTKAETRSAEAHADVVEQERDFTTSKYGKILMGIRNTLNTGLGGIVGGLGVGMGARAVAAALRGSGPSLSYDPRRRYD